MNSLVPITAPPVPQLVAAANLNPAKEFLAQRASAGLLLIAAVHSRYTSQPG